MKPRNQRKRFTSILRLIRCFTISTSVFYRSYLGSTPAEDTSLIVYTAMRDITHEYLGFSTGAFGNEISIKDNAAKVLDGKLFREKWKKDLTM